MSIPDLTPSPDAGPRPSRRTTVRLRRLAGTLVVFALVGAGLSVASCMMPELGLLDGHLRDCPDSPNCVSSQEQGDARVAPLAFTGDPSAAWAALRQVLADTPRAEITAETDGYLRLEFTTRLLRFTDDVEFLLDPAASVIHLRSASRVGWSDLGANRQRCEALRAAFTAALSGSPPR